MALTYNKADILPFKESVSLAAYSETITEMLKPESFPVKYDLKTARFNVDTIPADWETLYETCTATFPVAVPPPTFSAKECGLAVVKMRKVEDKLKALYDLAVKIEKHLNSLVNLQNTDGQNAPATLKALKSAKDLNPTEISEVEIKNFYGILDASKISALNAILDAHIVYRDVFLIKEDRNADGLSDTFAKLPTFDTNYANTMAQLNAFIKPNLLLLAEANKSVIDFSTAVSLTDIYGDSKEGSEK